jgi:uncharacterized membrane protein
MTGLGDLPGDIFASFATTTNGNGSVIAGAGYPTEGLFQAFRWTNGTGMVGLRTASGSFQESTAFGMSADGAVIVGERDSSLGPIAFRWTAATGLVSLTAPRNANGTTAFSHSARSVSPDGVVMVGEAQFRASGNPIPGVTQEAFLWTSTTASTRLGDLNGGTVSAGANDVDASGSIVVGFGNTDLGYEAFIWDATHGMRRLQDVLEGELHLDLTGWILNSAEGISADGNTIAGWGVDPLGNPEAWIATIPEPVLVAPTLVGLFLLFRRRRSFGQ